MYIKRLNNTKTVCNITQKTMSITICTISGSDTRASVIKHHHSGVREPDVTVDTGQKPTQLIMSCHRSARPVQMCKY